MANILTPDLVQARKETVIAVLKAGGSYTQACKDAKLSTATASSWRASDVVFDEAIQKHLQPRPQALHNQQRMPTRLAKDVKPEEKGDVLDELCDALAEGIPLDYACLLVNVSRGTVRDWMKEEGEIAGRINRAMAENIRFWIGRIRQGAMTDWKAALAYLERLFPAMFGEVKAVEITQRAGERAEQNIIDVTPEATVKRLSQMSDEDLQAIIGASV
jgi:hypothetical protein